MPDNAVDNTAGSTRGKLSFSKKFLWGIGGFGDSLMQNGVMVLAMPIYSIALGVNPGLIGLAVGLPKLLVAVLAPFMANLSDNTRSRWGRRRHYIAVGAVLAGFLFAVMWRPPSGLSDNGLFLYFLIISIVYYTTYTVFGIPYGALGMELTMDYNERTSLQAYRGFLAAVCGLLLPWAYKLSFNPVFGSNEAEGARIVGILYGSMMALTGIIPAIFCRENMAVQSQSKINFIQAFKYTLRNKPLSLMTGAAFFILVGIFLIQPIGGYLGIYYLFGGDKVAASMLIGVSGTIFAVGGLVVVPLVAYLGTHFGKKQTFLLGTVLVILASASTWFLYTPKYPYLVLIYFVVFCAGNNCFWIIVSSMMADICDIDELKCGLRREAMLGSVYCLVVQIGFAGSLAISGYIVAWTGVDPELGGMQTPEAIFWMRFLYAVVPMVCLGISFVLMYFYPITEKRSREVRAIIDERKNKAADQLQNKTEQPK